MKPIAPITIILGSLAVAGLAHGQTAPKTSLAVPAAVSPSKGLTFTADRQQVRANGVRLDGHARVQSPGELDAAADTIALDADDKGLSQVRALGNVKLKVDVPARNGSTPVHVESSSQGATLDPRTSTLVLTGRVAGWYQPLGGARVALGGEKVTVKFDKTNLSLNAVGGQTPAVVAVPLPDSGPTAGIGTVTMHANAIDLSQNAESTFTGAARATSNGARKFDLASDNFAVTRGTDGTLDTIKTAGHTTLVTDLPAGTPEAGSFGTPVRLEVSADSSLVKRVDNTLTFLGNVKGFYILQNAAGEQTKYPFSGDRAVVTFVPATATVKADFNLVFSGAPSTIEAPRFDLGL